MMKKSKRCLALVLAAGISVGATVNTQSFDLDSLVGAVGDFIADNLTEEEQYEVIDLAIQKILNSDFFRQGNTRDKIEQLKEVIIETGLVDADTVEAVTDSILQFEFEGIKIDVLVDYLDYMLYDEVYEDDVYEYKDYIAPDKTTNKTAQIMYGLGFEEIEDQLNYSADKWSRHGLQTSINNSCTVEDFKTQLSGSDLVIIEEHGNFDFSNTPMIVTEEEANFSSMHEKYADDLDSGRIKAVVTYDGTMYWLMPSFFEYYYGNHGLDGTIVWIGSCEGNKNSDLVDSLTSCGAQVVLAHSESVYTQYDYCILNNTIDEMINGKSMEESIEAAKQNWGYDDDEFYNNTPHLFNNDKATSYPCLTGNASWS